MYYYLLFLSAFYISLSTGQPARTCALQESCLDIERNPIGYGDRIEVCLIYQQSPRCTATQPLDYACSTEDASDLTSLWEPGRANKMCKTVRCGTMANFGINDGSACKGSISSTTLSGVDGISCKPKAYCGGYMTTGRDCRWSIPSGDCPMDTPMPTPDPVDPPTPVPTSDPTDDPTTPSPTTSSPTTADPTKSPTDEPTTSPSDEPTTSPSDEPTTSPSDEPTTSPSDEPTASPSDEPTSSPSDEPTSSPTDEPTKSPTDEPTTSPSDEPTTSPSDEPTTSPSDEPTSSPSDEPTMSPTDEPTTSPSDEPTSSPSDEPTESPTDEPTMSPSEEPTMSPSDEPTESPTDEPTTSEPTTASPTSAPTYTECDTEDALNIGFLLDESGSVSLDEWGILLNFVRRIINFDIAPTSYVSLYEYAQIQSFLKFQDFTQNDAAGNVVLNNALTAAESDYNTAGTTRTWDAVNRVLDDFWSYRDTCTDGCQTREDMLFLVTDGAPTGEQVCPNMTARMSTSRVDVFILIIDPDGVVDESEIDCLDVEDNQQDVYNIVEFESDAFVAVESAIRAKTCNGNNPAGPAREAGEPWYYSDGSTDRGPIPTGGGGGCGGCADRTQAGDAVPGDDDMVNHYYFRHDKPHEDDNVFKFNNRNDDDDGGDNDGGGDKWGFKEVVNKVFFVLIVALIVVIIGLVIYSDKRMNNHRQYKVVDFDGEEEDMILTEDAVDHACV